MEQTSQTTSEEALTGFDMSGLELLKMGLDDPSLHPAIAKMLGMRLVGLDEGRVTFEIDTRADYANPVGTVSGGITATVIDAAMACAVHSALPPRTGYTTVDLALTFLRSVPAGGQVLRAEGSLVHLGRRIATAEGRVTDGDGELVATARTTCMIIRRD